MHLELTRPILHSVAAFPFFAFALLVFYAGTAHAYDCPPGTFAKYYEKDIGYGTGWRCRYPEVLPGSKTGSQGGMIQIPGAKIKPKEGCPEGYRLEEHSNGATTCNSIVHEQANCEAKGGTRHYDPQTGKCLKAFGRSKPSN